MEYEADPVNDRTAGLLKSQPDYADRLLDLLPFVTSGARLRHHRSRTLGTGHPGTRVSLFTLLLHLCQHGGAISAQDRFSSGVAKPISEHMSGPQSSGQTWQVRGSIPVACLASDNSPLVTIVILVTQEGFR